MNFTGLLFAKKRDMKQREGGEMMTKGKLLFFIIFSIIGTTIGATIENPYLFAYGLWATTFYLWVVKEMGVIQKVEVE